MQRGIKLEQHKAESLLHPVQELPDAAGLPPPKFFRAPKGRPDWEAVLRAAEEAEITDEFEDVPLAEKLRRMRRAGVSLALACCVDEDPYTTSAMAALREQTDGVIAGLALAARACGAKKSEIAVADRREKKEILRRSPEAKLVVAGTRYPARALLRRSLQAEGGKAAFVGAQACAALAAAVSRGEAQHDAIVTVAGSGVEIPRNVRVRIGTPLRHLLDFCGVHERTRLIVTGSSVTGRAVTDPSVPVTAATRCVIAMLRPPRYKTYACIGCGRCSRACPRGIVPWRIYQEMERSRPDPLKLLNARSCIDCASCSMICPSGLDLAAAVKRAAAIMESGDLH
jgi:Na+-translocating ferredoxin:NAD+ oxidoreductase RnfC subunit